MSLKDIIDTCYETLPSESLPLAVELVMAIYHQRELRANQTPVHEHLRDEQYAVEGHMISGEGCYIEEDYAHRSLNAFARSHTNLPIKWADEKVQSLIKAYFEQYPAHKKALNQAIKGFRKIVKDENESDHAKLKSLISFQSFLRNPLVASSLADLFACPSIKKIAYDLKHDLRKLHQVTELKEFPGSYEHHLKLIAQTICQQIEAGSVTHEDIAACYQKGLECSESGAKLRALTLVSKANRLNEELDLSFV